MSEYRSRKNENCIQEVADRSSRFKQDESGYYFYRTREGELRGPFATQSAANYDLHCFIDLVHFEEECLGKQIWA